MVVESFETKQTNKQKTAKANYSQYSPKFFKVIYTGK